jgi:hypothetical protein
VTKKLFALASVSAIAGIMTTVTASGCSSTSVSPSPADSGADVTSEVGTGTGPEPIVCPAVLPLTAADLDNEVNWKPAKAVPGACSTQDLAQLETNFKGIGIQSYYELGKDLSPDCFACVLTKDTDATWGPFVATEADDGKTGFVNYGACFGYVEDVECGKAVQYEQFCYNVACNKCTTTKEDRQDCVAKAGADGMCADFKTARNTACPNIDASAKKCNSIIDSAKTLCGAAPADAGED